MVDWKVVLKESVPIIRSFIDRGVVPTVRTVYYALVSKNFIPNTTSAYKRLSSVLVDARKNSVVQWGWIARNVEQGCSTILDLMCILAQNADGTMWKRRLRRNE
jgi:hypothetical protein